jgi:hypothetical protein
MQKYKNILDDASFLNLLENAKLEYLSDTSWAYSIETTTHCLDFYQDESGKNHLEQFCVNVDGVWFNLMATDKQLKLMFAKLEATPYKTVEKEFESGYIDWYDYNGVQPSDFY